MVLHKQIRLSHDAGIFNSLPLDLWFTILSFLPIQSLLILRSVCKSLLSIIHDPRLASLHLNRSPSNLSETQFLTVQLNSKGTVFELRNTTTNTVTRFPEPALQTGGETGGWDLAGSLDGLVLLVSTRFVENTRRTVLWNPSVRKLRKLKLPSAATRHLGLGYCRRSNDYKVVAMTGYSWSTVVSVYSVKYGSWTEILSSGFGRRFGDKSVYSQSLAFDDGVFWVEYSSTSKELRHGLVWFGFGDEKFRYAKLPYSVDPKGKRTGSRLVMLDGGSSVGVWGVEEERQGYVWGLEMEKMSWVKRYKIDRKMIPTWTGSERVRFVERNGELVWKFWTKDSRCVKVFSYDIATQRIKRSKEFAGLVEDCLGVYFESLVML